MDKLGDMELFVKVIKNGGLAAAGRVVGLSPARMTARINGLEQRYGTRLLNRTTRQVNLTEEGRIFFDACQRVLSEVEQAEAQLQVGKATLSGPLRITAPSDIGQLHIVPIIDQFVADFPNVQPYVYLSDGIMNLSDQNFDLAIRYGALPDSNLISKNLYQSHRVLCASPDYLARKGTPRTPQCLIHHDCLALVREVEPLVTWHFHKDSQHMSMVIKPARSTNDGAQVRRWAVEGAGIALKSYCDVADDIEHNRLQVILADYNQDFQKNNFMAKADLHVVYPSRSYLPERVKAFIERLSAHFNQLKKIEAKSLAVSPNANN
ncbi:LysR family transcriptional regulator [Shewanella intestini]|uniref:LysR family transcriptional regulator n=1 Tax=Shewanella intestini TaxID=2017544 RepID=A0ABS5I205_9GAMM|nr:MULTISPECIES: LysR family transcriptional regulator [Shewanella]MBR9728055.1 LysR family transcriptional regulator [Shewanella intestini]MRG36393.1 LysR family transcriptional regulator [Shewanella sp. XMDDZSB0408]